jgi:shikimate kinase
LSNIILCGFKSCGKSTLAKKISERTGLHYIDTDELIAKNNRKFYLEVGPEAFRDIEKKVIQALIGFENCIIATGGGVVLDPENILILKKLGKIFYLRVPKEELKCRLLTDPLPAILDPENPEESFEKMYHDRKDLYEKIADHIIDSEEQVWALIL